MKQENNKGYAANVPAYIRAGLSPSGYAMMALSCALAGDLQGRDTYLRLAEQEFEEMQAIRRCSETLADLSERILEIEGRMGELELRQRARDELDWLYNPEELNSYLEWINSIKKGV